MKILLKIVINAIALWLAARFVSGVGLSGDWVSILIVALIFGGVNAIIKPVLKLLSFPFIIVTLGFFTLIINAFMLKLTAWLSTALTVESYKAAFLGAIIVTLVSWALSAFLDDDDKSKKQQYS